jgi:synaptosomal-associated protein 29
MNNQNFSSVDSKNINDLTFAGRAKQNSSLNSSNSLEDWKEKRRKLLEERREIEERTLNDSKITLGLVHESEKIGLNTAQELVRQREQLNNVEDKLDSMSAHLKDSQKHLTSMKSFFGGFKNYFSRNSDKTQTIRSSETKNTNNTIDSMENNFYAQNHPALSQRGVHTNGFVLDEEETDQIYSQQSSRSRQFDEELELNLNEIDSGVDRLKQLSLSLGNEIDSQNSLLDRITKDAERAEGMVKNQNIQMRQILRK